MKTSTKFDMLLILSCILVMLIATQLTEQEELNEEVNEIQCSNSTTNTHTISSNSN